MQYHYVAAQKNGRLVEGDIDAVNEGEVLSFLSRKELKPVSVEKINQRALKTKALLSGRVTIAAPFPTFDFFNLATSVATACWAYS